MGNYTTSYTIDTSGNPISLSAYTSGGCKNNTITLDKEDEDNWFYFTSDTRPEGVKITVSAKTSDGNTHSCKLTPTINNKQCNAITFTQESDCDCPHNKVWSNIIVLPQSGVGNSDSDWYLCYQSRYESISEECIDGLSVDTEGAAHYANSEFKIEKNQDPNSANTIDIYIRNVSANTKKEVDTDEMIIKYGNNNCNEIYIKQYGIVECTCDGTREMITVLKTEFGIYGTSDFVTFASGNTYGCGELALSAVTSEESMIEDWRTISHQEDDINYYEWQCKVRSLGEVPEKTVGFDIYYKDLDGTTFPGCGEPIVLIQNKTVCDCPIIEDPNQSYEYTLPNGKSQEGFYLKEDDYGTLLSGITLQELTYVTGGSGRTCNWIIPTSDCDWVTLYSSKCDMNQITKISKLTGINLGINRNNTGEERSCIIELHGYEGFYNGQYIDSAPKLGNYFWFSGRTDVLGVKDCGKVGEIKLIQPEDGACNCNTNIVTSGYSVGTLSSKIGSKADVYFSFSANDSTSICAQYSGVTLLDSNDQEIGWADKEKLESINVIRITRTAVTDNDEVIKVRIHYTVDNGVECYGDIEVNTIGCSCDDIVGNVNTKGIVLAQTGGTGYIPLGELGHLFSDCYDDDNYKTPLENNWNITITNSWARNPRITTLYNDWVLAFEYDSNPYSEDRTLYIEFALNEPLHCQPKLIQVPQRGTGEPCATCNPVWRASDIEVENDEIGFISTNTGTSVDMFSIPTAATFVDETCNGGKTLHFGLSNNVPNYLSVERREVDNRYIYSVKAVEENTSTEARHYYYYVQLLDANNNPIKDKGNRACQKVFYIDQYGIASCESCQQSFIDNITQTQEQIDNTKNIIESDTQYYSVATLPNIEENCFKYKIQNGQEEIIDVKIEGNLVMARGKKTIFTDCHTASFNILVFNLSTNEYCNGSKVIVLKIKQQEGQQCEGE